MHARAARFLVTFAILVGWASAEGKAAGWDASPAEDMMGGGGVCESRLWQIQVWLSQQKGTVQRLVGRGSGHVDGKQKTMEKGTAQSQKFPSRN